MQCQQDKASSSKIIEQKPEGPTYDETNHAKYIFSPRSMSSCPLLEDEVPAQKPPDSTRAKSTNCKPIQLKRTRASTKSKFNMQMVENPLYIRLQEALKVLDNNNLPLAEQMLSRIYVSASSKLDAQSNPILKKQFMVICVQSLSYLSKVYQMEGKLGRAILTLENALDRFVVKDLHVLAQLQYQMGVLHQLQTTLQESLQHFYEALQLYERLNWPVEQADCMMKMGVVYAMLKEFEIAKKLSYEALEIYRKYTLMNDIKVGRALFSLGKIFFIGKEYEVAEEYCAQSLGMQISHYDSPRHYNLIGIYNLIAILHQVQSKPEEAIDYYKKALMCFGGTVEVQLGQIIANMALAHLEMKHKKHALECFNQAEQVYNLYLYPSHHLMIRLHNNIKLLQ